MPICKDSCIDRFERCRVLYVVAALLALAATAVAAQPAAARNLLANSSFELGADHRYAIGRWFVNGLPNTHLDEATKVHGKASLKLPFSVRGYAPDGPYGIELRAGVAVMAEKGKTYTFSAYLKTDVPDLSASLEISPNRPYAYRGRPIASKKITLGRHYTPQGFEYPWTRQSLTFTAEKTEEVFWVVRVGSKRPGALWVDAVQFEEGNLSDYRPMLAMETGLFDGAIGHIHDPGKPPEVRLTSYNDGTASTRQRAQLRILNDVGAVVSERTLEVTAPSNGRTQETVALDTGGKRGLFVAELTLPDGPPGYRQDTSFTVLPKPRPVAPQHSSIGAYITASEEALRIFARAGFHWTATLTSAEVMANWSMVERQKGKYAWRDADVELFRRYGFEIMMNLEGWAYPRWADKLTIAEKTQAFARYVEAATRHFRGRVRYFNLTDEIHNKLPGNGMIGGRKATWRNPEEYAAWHRVVQAAAKRGNPDAQVVLNTDIWGFSPKNLFRFMSPKTVDVVAGNYYPYPGAVATLKAQASANGIATVWAPGVVIHTWPMYFRDERHPLDAGYGRHLNEMVRKIIRSFANGAQVIFHYTGTYVGNTNVYSLLEHDSSLKAGGSVFAALAWLVDDFTKVRRFKIVRANEIEAYRFDRRDGQTVFALWSKLESPGQSLVFKSALHGVKVYDRWTNAEPVRGAKGLETVDLGEETRFLITPTADADAVERSLTIARFKVGALPRADKVARAGPYALVTKTVGKGKRQSTHVSLWYDVAAAGWIELLERQIDKRAPAAALDANGLTLRFHFPWDGKAGHLVVGTLSSDIFWGERFWRSTTGRQGLVWQSGEILDKNLHGRVLQAAPAKAAGPVAGLEPTAYTIDGSNGLTLTVETTGEQPNPRYPMPGGWDIYVWRGKGMDRTIGIWRFVHAGEPRERDLRVRVRVAPKRP